VCNGSFGICITLVTCPVKPSDGGSACPGSDNVAIQCKDACDCSGGQVCCGSTSSANTTCQTVASGGTCPGAGSGTGAQLCQVSAECTQGQQCISQTCTEDGVSAQFTACGLQSGCTAN
jgi:hypothetical protein